MDSDKNINNLEKLEFAIFCIENIASELELNAAQVYTALTEKSNVLNDYIIPSYDVLHTQSKNYIVQDIIELMEERGVQV